MQAHVFRTVGYRIKDEQLTMAARAVCLASRNLRNCGLFIVRNILSAHGEGGFKSADKLNAHEMAALALANKAVDACNATRQTKSSAGKATPALLSRFNEGDGGASCWQILNLGLLDKTLRMFTDPSGAKPYDALPCVAAKQVTAQIIREFASWRGSLKAWKARATGANRPQFPGYQDKRQLNPMLMHVEGMGVKRLPTIKGRALYLDHEKSRPLPAEAFAAWKALDFARLIAELTRMVDRPGAELAMVRVLPKRGRFWIEGVFKCPVAVEERSFLGRLLLSASPEMRASQPEGAEWQAIVVKSLTGLDARALQPQRGSTWASTTWQPFHSAQATTAWLCRQARLKDSWRASGGSGINDGRSWRLRRCARRNLARTAARS